MKETIQANLASGGDSVQRVIEVFLAANGITGVTARDVLTQLEKRVFVYGKHREQVISGFNEYFAELYRQSEKGRLIPSEGQLQIEDCCLTGEGGMLRLYTGDLTYLWLAFIVLPSAELSPYSGSDTDSVDCFPVRYIGAAISAYADTETEEIYTKVPFEDQPRVTTLIRPQFYFTSNLDSDLDIKFHEEQYDGIFNCIHVQVSVDGIKAGYYFSY